MRKVVLQLPPQKKQCFPPSKGEWIEMNQLDASNLVFVPFHVSLLLENFEICPVSTCSTSSLLGLRPGFDGEDGLFCKRKDMQLHQNLNDPIVRM